ncbi:MAG TPA: TlpA disulfide reductase family protein [Acidobacteriota bacterium]
MKQGSESFLESGQLFPEFALKDAVGMTHSLSSVVGDAPLVLFALFKTDCPTSQFSLPYMNNLVKAIPELPFVGISQDEPAETAEFLENWGIRFSLVLFDQDPYELSDSLGISNVPALFLVARSGKILESDFGYSADFWERLAQRTAAEFGRTIGPIIPSDAPRWAGG